MAFIEYNEINEFSMKYNIDWKEALIENDIEAIIDKKHNISYLDYRITDKDYFMGCHTMLNNEKAALAKAE